LTRSTAGSRSATLPAHKIGRLWKFKLSVVDDWVRKQDARVTDDEHRPEGDE